MSVGLLGFYKLCWIRFRGYRGLLDEITLEIEVGTKLRAGRELTVGPHDAYIVGIRRLACRRHGNWPC